MGELIGLPQVAKILGVKRQTAWALYKKGKIQAVTVVGGEMRPRPLFSRVYIESLRAQLGKAA